MQNVEVWLSSESIASGQLWVAQLKEALSQTNFGISMVTKANMNAPYLLFEAGALSKLNEGRLVPILCDLRVIELKGPLSSFQSVGVNAHDFWKLVSSVNEASEDKVEEPRLKRNFDKWWPDFERDFASINFDEEGEASGPETPDKRLSNIEDALETLLKSTLQRDVFLQNIAETMISLARNPIAPGGYVGLVGAGGGGGYGTPVGGYGVGSTVFTGSAGGAGTSPLVSGTKIIKGSSEPD